MVNNYFGIYVQAMLAKNSSQTLQKQLNAIKDLQIKVTPTFGNISKAELTKVNNELKSQLENITKEAKNLDLTPTVNKEALNKLNSGYTLVKKSLTNVSVEAKKTGESFNLLNNFTNKSLNALDSLVGTVGKVAVWSVATNAIFGTKKALEDLFNTYVELENKLVSIERVTKNFDMSAIFTGAYQNAQNTGAALFDMLDSVEEIARSYSNLNEQEVLAAANAGVLASTIAEMDGKDAVQAIIAVSNAYGFAIENGEKLIDMANEVDNNFSVTATNITKAWEKSSATAVTFGVEIEKLTGYIAAISTVTQESGETIGNGLKTIMSRITTMDSAIEAIKSAGVDIFDPVTNEARDVQDILEDLAGKWNELSNTEQQNIGVKVAGRYQLTRFLALMNNYNIVTEATTTAINSEGSAVRENAKYLDTYKAKLTQLENAQINLSEAINNSTAEGLGKTFLDLKIVLTDVTTSYFNNVDAITVAAGGMIALLSILSQTTNGYKVLTSTLSMFMTTEQAEIVVNNLSAITKNKNSVATGAFNAMMKISSKITTESTLAKIAESTADKKGVISKVAHTVATSGLTVAETACTVAASLLAVALNALPFVAVITVIGLLVKGIFDAVNANKEYNNSLKEQNENIINNKNGIDSLKQSYENARQARIDYESGNITSASDYNDLITAESDTLNKLIEQYPALKEELNDENKSWAEKKKLMDEADKKAQDAAKNELENAKKKYEAQRNTLNQTKEQIALNEEMKSKFNINSDFNSFQTPVNSYTGISTTEKEEKANQKALEDTRNSLNETLNSYRTYYNAIGEITTVEDEWIKRLQEIGITNSKTKEELDAVNLVVTKFIEEASNGKITTEGFQKALEQIGLTEVEVSSVMEDYSTVIDENKNEVEDYTEELKSFNDSCGSVIDTLFQLQDGAEDAANNMINFSNISSLFSQSDINDKVNSFAESFTFLGDKVWDSSKTLEENMEMIKAVSETLAIARTDEEYYAEAVSNGILYVSKGRKEAFETFRTNKINELTTEKETVQQKITALQAEINAENISCNNTKNYCEANIKNFSQLELATNSWATSAITNLKNYNNALNNNIYSTKNEEKAKNYSTYTPVTNSNASKLSDLKAELSSLDKQISSWSNLKIVETTSTAFKKMSNSASDASKSTKTYFEKLKEAWEDYKNTIDGIDLELQILQERFKNLDEGTSAWFNNIEQQRKVIERQKSAIQNYINVMRSQLNSDKVSASEKIELNNLIQEQTLAYEKLNTELTKLTDTEKDYYKTQIEKKIELINNIEDERHNNVMDNIKSERDAFKKQIDEQLALMKKASAARTYEQDLNELQEKRLNILTQISRLEGDDSRLAQSKLADLYNELKDTNKEIDNLNYDRNTELREDALNDLSDSVDNYYDGLEDTEDKKNELITEAFSTANDNLDEMNYSLGELVKQLQNWDGVMSNFNSWAEGFNDLIGTLPTSNIISSAIPLNSNNTDENGNTVTQVVLNITANSNQAGDIANAAIDALKAAGVITKNN